MPTVQIPTTEEQLRQVVADQLGLPPGDVGAEDDLIELGMDSVTIMTLVGRWQRNGLGASAAEFAERPTISAWWEHMARHSPNDT